MLNLFYITNHPTVAQIAQKSGVDRIWIDLETVGKAERQKNMNTVKSRHSISDIEKIKPLLTNSELLVRINPWGSYSYKEIDDVIEAGADIVMLPMWKTVDEVKRFLSCVGGRSKTMLLLETKEAVECVDEVLRLDFDEIHIGLNDLHLSYGMHFLFEPLAVGMVDSLCEKFRQRHIPYGFGGIARLGAGLIPSEMIIEEHYRLGSTRAILSRSFCQADQIDDMVELDRLFTENMRLIREFEKKCEVVDAALLDSNHRKVVDSVNAIVRESSKNA